MEERKMELLGQTIKRLLDEELDKTHIAAFGHSFRQCANCLNRLAGYVLPT